MHGTTLLFSADVVVTPGLFTCTNHKSRPIPFLVEETENGMSWQRAQTQQFARVKNGKKRRCTDRKKELLARLLCRLDYLTNYHYLTPCSALQRGRGIYPNKIKISNFFSKKESFSSAFLARVFFKTLEPHFSIQMDKAKYGFQTKR